MWAWILADCLLALGACLRLTRFVVADDVPGAWWIKDPLSKASNTRYLDGLDCPFCVGVWMSAAVVLGLFLAGGPGEAAHWWRYGAGFLSLAWVTGHVAARVGDVEEP